MCEEAFEVSWKCDLCLRRATKASPFTFDADIGNNVFHHVALVVDRTNNEVRLYTDGVQTMSGSNVAMDISNVVGSVDNALPLNFGGQDGIDSLNLDGKLDEIQIVNSALSDAEILAAATIP